MPGFIAVGKRWLNVDAIRMVEVDEDAKGEPHYTVYFSGGETAEFSGDDARALLEVIKKNRVNGK